MEPTRLRASLATLTDRARSAADRALAATFLASEIASGEPIVTSGTPSNDPAQRMFAYGVRHPDAAPWDGRGTRSGTITSIAVDRIEQYVGGGRWVAYDPQVFGATVPDIGDQVRIARRNGAVEIERIGPNRLAGTRTDAREASSGMLVLRCAPLDEGEIEETLEAVARRYDGTLTVDGESARIEIGDAAACRLRLVSDQMLPDYDPSALLPGAIEAAIRLDAAVRSDRAGAALGAERAMILCAALLTTGAPAVAIDDAGAVFSAERLYELAARNETRADAFTFAAAAAQRVHPPSPAAFFEGVADELTLFSSRPSRADSAFVSLRRVLTHIAAAAAASEDPLVPPQLAVPAIEDRGEPGEAQWLVQLAYERVEIAVAFVDATATDASLAAAVGSRSDVEAILGDAIRSAVVFTVSTRDTGGADDGLELRRADAFVTALAASFARREDAIASDASGRLYAVDDLVDLALHRRTRAAGASTA